MAWSAPLTVHQLLQRVIDHRLTWPDSAIWPIQPRGVYLVSEHPWAFYPNPNLMSTPRDPLVRYVGKSDAKTPQFAARFGQLVIGLAGYGDRTWIGHQGAYNLLEYVSWENPIINPLNFYVAWRTDYVCPSCAEIGLYGWFRCSLKQKRPRRCASHNPSYHMTATLELEH